MVVHSSARWIIARGTICTSSYKAASWISPVCWLWQSDSLLVNRNVLRGLDHWRAAVAGFSMVFLFLSLSVYLSVCLTYSPAHTHTHSVQSAITQEHTVTEASHLAAISPHKTAVQQCVRGSHHCLICFKHALRPGECVLILCLSTQGSTVQVCSLWMRNWRRRVCYYGYHGLDLGSILQMQLVMFPSLLSLYGEDCCTRMDSQSQKVHFPLINVIRKWACSFWLCPVPPQSSQNNRGTLLFFSVACWSHFYVLSSALAVLFCSQPPLVSSAV